MSVFSCPCSGRSRLHETPLAFRGIFTLTRVQTFVLELFCLMVLSCMQPIYDTLAATLGGILLNAEEKNLK